ncbi:GtrA family protein [Methylocaldum gracile]|jgi:putative flippase GtrA
MRQFIYFLISGGLAALLNWSSRFLFSIWIPFEASIVAAFFVGLGSGFLLMRLYVFGGEKKPVLPQITKYVLINMLALAQTLAISVLLARWMLPAMGVMEHVESSAHLAGVLFPVITSYFGHKLLTFR